MILPLIALLMAPNSEASLLFSADSVMPGESFTAAVQIKLDPGWHTYWKNPGDSGSTPTVKWKVPVGWTVGPIRWPIPMRHQTADGADFIYENEVLLLTTITAPKVGSRPSLPNQPDVAVPVSTDNILKADVSWLVCQEACVPANQTVSAPIKIGRALPSKSFEFLAEAVQKLPTRIVNGWKAKAVTGGVALMRADGDPIEAGTLFFPSVEGTWDHADKGALSSDGKTLTFKKSPYASAAAKKLQGLILLPNGVGQEIDIPIVS